MYDAWTWTNNMIRRVNSFSASIALICKVVRVYNLQLLSSICQTNNVVFHPAIKKEGIVHKIKNGQACHFVLETVSVSISSNLLPPRLLIAEIFLTP